MWPWLNGDGRSVADVKLATDFALFAADLVRAAVDDCFFRIHDFLHCYGLNDFLLFQLSVYTTIYFLQAESPDDHRKEGQLIHSGLFGDLVSK